MNEKNAVILVCLGDKNHNADLLQLAIRSLRDKACFDGTIIVFTDFDRKLQNEDRYKINRITINNTKVSDPRNFRIYMDEFYDFSAHEKLIYIDFDTLACNWADLLDMNPL